MNYFLDHWQQLLGSLLGPFLGIILTGVGFLVKEKYQSLKEIKNNHNNIEISLTLSLNEIFQRIELIKKFQQDIGRTIKIEENDNIFTNHYLPPIRDIFVDDALMHVKTRNYYIHNKLLWTISGIKNANAEFSNIRDDYRDSCNKIFSLMIAGKNSSPPNKMSVSNLNDLMPRINAHIDYLIKGVMNLLQVRVFNNKLLGKGWYRRRVELRKYRNIPPTLNGITAIDALINSEVQENLRRTPLP